MHSSQRAATRCSFHPTYPCASWCCGCISKREHIRWKHVCMYIQSYTQLVGRLACKLRKTWCRHHYDGKLWCSPAILFVSRFAAVSVILWLRLFPSPFQHAIGATCMFHREGPQGQVTLICESQATLNRWKAGGSSLVAELSLDTCCTGPRASTAAP